MQLLGALARPAGFSAGPLDRLDRIHGLLQDLRVMDVGGAEDYRERDAPSVCHNMALRARFCLIRRIRAGSSAPLWPARSPSPKKPAPNLSGRPRPGGPTAPDAALPTPPPPASRASAASRSIPSRSPSLGAASPRVCRSS